MNKLLTTITLLCLSTISMAETYVCTVVRDSEIVETNTFTRTLTGFDSEQRLTRTGINPKSWIESESQGHKILSEESLIISLVHIDSIDSIDSIDRITVDIINMLNGLYRRQQVDPFTEQYPLREGSCIRIN